MADRNWREKIDAARYRMVTAYLRTCVLLTVPYKDNILEKPSIEEDKNDAAPEDLPSEDTTQPAVLKNFYKDEERDIDIQSGPKVTGLRKANTEEF